MKIGESIYRNAGQQQSNTNQEQTQNQNQDNNNEQKWKEHSWLFISVFKTNYLFIKDN